MPKIKILNSKTSPLNAILWIKKHLSHGEEGQYNIIHLIHDSKGMATEMLDNESMRGVRKYYHETISFHPKDEKKCTPDFIYQFVHDYIQAYFENNKIYWGMQRDKAHPILHLCLSATKLDGSKMHFDAVKLMAKDRYVQSYCKERGLDYFDSAEIKKAAQTEPERHMKNRNLETNKDFCRNAISEAINSPQVTDKQSFVTELKNKNIEISKRETGVVYNDRILDLQLSDLKKNFIKMIYSLKIPYTLIPSKLLH